MERCEGKALRSSGDPSLPARSSSSHTVGCRDWTAVYMQAKKDVFALQYSQFLKGTADRRTDTKSVKKF